MAEDDKMIIKKRFIVIVIFASILSIGCTHIVRTNWVAEIPFEQDGTVRLFLGQEKPYPGVFVYPYGSLSIILNSTEKIKDVKFFTSDVKVQFLKKGTVIKEMEIFLHDFEVDENNIINGGISKYGKYLTPSLDKEYSLNWDEFMEYAKESDKIECSIQLKFEANGQLYNIQKMGNLIKDVKRDVFFGMYE